MSPEIRQENQSFVQETQNSGNNLFESIRNAARNRLAIAGIGLVAVLGAAKMSLQPEPVQAAAGEATASDLRQECVQEGLKMPNVLKAEMRNPGKVGGQGYFVRVNYPGMSSGCVEAGYSRVAQGRAQKQNPKKRKKWINLESYWRSMFTPGYSHNDEGIGQLSGSSTGHEPNSYYLRNNEKARVLLRSKVRLNKKVIAQRTKPHPIKVIGKYRKR